jgi:hypothetical protein
LFIGKADKQDSLNGIDKHNNNAAFAILRRVFELRFLGFKD